MATALKEACWTHIVSAFPLLSNEVQIPEMCDDETFENIKKMIKEKKLIHIVTANVMHRIINNIYMNMSNSFWVHFLSEEITELNVLRNAREILPTDFTGFERFRRAIDDLFILIQSHTSTINRVQLLYEDDETNLLKNFFERIRALMYSQLPINYKTIIYNFYRTGLRIMYFKANMNYFDVTLDQCSGCNYEKTYCNCENTLQAFCKTNMQLSHIGIMETLAEDVVIELVYSIIENEVAVRVTDNFGDSLLPLLYHWLCNILFDWIKKILDPGCCPTYGQCKLNAILNKLKYSLYKSFTKIRFNQIYDIIIRFPYSEPAVDDLTVSLGNSDLNPELRILLQNNLKSKLLQPNMSTVDVLYVYTSAIRVLRKIDPSGILLAEVAQLIQAFSRKREDTIHCIISMLISNSSNEFLRSKTILDEEFASLKNCEQNHCRLINNSYSCDVVALLIDVCGSRELFAHEYKVLLADRLLVMENMNIFSREEKYLKLIESRIGGSLLSSCSMMLKDIDSSKNINQYFYDPPSPLDAFNICRYNLLFTVKGIIICDYYWPKLEDDFIVKLPDVFLAHLNVYKKCYEAYKVNRTLIWNPNVGKVKMDIIINKKCLSITVSPIQATVLWHFQNQEEWTIDDLSTKMNVPSKKLIVFIGFWINKGLLKRQQYDTVILLKNLPGGTPDYVPDENDVRSPLNYVFDENVGITRRNDDDFIL